MIFDTDKLHFDSDYRAELKFRFLTDHFFAAELLGFNDFNRRAHGPAVELYFPKNPNVPIREQHKVHKRLHLDPRHTFKTTLKRIDRIQWIAAFPEEITILVESATQPLAAASAQKSALPFWNGSKNPILHKLFPEIVCVKYPELTSGRDGTHPTAARSARAISIPRWPSRSPVDTIGLAPDDR